MNSTRTSQTAGESRAQTSGATTPADAAETSTATTVASTADAGEVTEVPKMSEVRGVRYVGIADVRRLSKQSLASMGIEDPKQDLEFNAANGKFIPASQFNAATRDWFASQRDFVIE